jgi:hypothetical protein
MNTEQDTHQELLFRVLSLLKKSGYLEIKASLKGYAAPPTIFGVKGNYKPDIFCKKKPTDETAYIIEIDTCTSIFDDVTAIRWTLFADFARKTSNTFQIVIPKNCMIEGSMISGTELVRRRLQELEIDPGTVSILTM